MLDTMFKGGFLFTRSCVLRLCTGLYFHHLIYHTHECCRGPLAALNELNGKYAQYLYS